MIFNLLLLLITLGFASYFIWLCSVMVKTWRIKNLIRSCGVSEADFAILISSSPLFGISIAIPLFIEIATISNGNHRPWTFLIFIPFLYIIHKIINKLPKGGYDYQRVVVAHLRIIRISAIASICILILIWTTIFLSKIHA